MIANSQQLDSKQNRRMQNIDRQLNLLSYFDSLPPNTVKVKYFLSFFFKYILIYNKYD